MKRIYGTSIVCYHQQPTPLVRHLPHAVQLRDLPPAPRYHRRHLHQDLRSPHQVSEDLDHGT